MGIATTSNKDLPIQRQTNALVALVLSQYEQRQD